MRKMRKMRKVVFLMLLLPFYALGNTGTFQIKTIQVEHGHVYIFNSEMKNPKNCGRSGVVKLDKGSDGFKEMYSMALTAYTTGEKIGFWSNRCTISPWGGQTVNTAYASYLSK